MAQSGRVAENTDCIFVLEKDSPNDGRGYDTKQSDCEVQIMRKIWGMQSIPSLTSLQGAFWPGVEASDRFLSMGQKEVNCALLLNWIVERELFRHVNCVLMLNWIAEMELFRHVNCALMLNWIVEIELFRHVNCALILNWIVEIELFRHVNSAVMLNWIVERELFRHVNCALMLNWVVEI